MQQLPKSLLQKLEERNSSGMLRKLTTPEGSSRNTADFASNDYLGLSQNKAIFNAAHQYLIKNNTIANGATGSRLISGNSPLHEETEKFIADFHNSESAIIYNSGYDANIGFFSCVPQKGDIVLYDEFIHASIRDGLRLSLANSYKFTHNSIDNLESLLQLHTEKAATVYVVTESVFSMDGDSPDLLALVSLAENYNCKLIVDEAHAIGVFGTKGEGLLQQLGLDNKVFARIVTFGKALGCHGAAVLGNSALKEYLINFSRSFIYTTALPPHALATIQFAYKEIAKNTTARKTLHKNISYFTETLQQEGVDCIESNSAIHCVVIPGNEKVKSIAKYLQQNGYNVKAILSPTVPSGQERLRFCLHSYNTKNEIVNALTALKAARSHYA
ncbi:8-amino-7-oxononanoate synthase [Flavobacterium suaedae]|uniref:8-amino-7-oxononanoate synthase n=1 Tax=Flavobacterium suaedae TaxID=1767027 RepID=A0ABQ1JYU4_9FLAO|nr:8-amino-7-oxononanoate synthase [Flavobacterium suaedae]GGB78398.1 8-amino-7-oxononanoate synthase [Flavobacterium suaedae]